MWRRIERKMKEVYKKKDIYEEYRTGVGY